MQAISVLLVDDNAILAEAFPRVLARDARFRWAGWVSNTRGLLDRIIDACPDIILMDVDMPGIDTFDIVRQITARCQNARTVMFSGHLREEYTDAAFDAGAHGYLHKDDDLATLLDNIERAHRGELVLSPLVQRNLWRP